MTGVGDVSGSVDQVGTTYIVHFGPMKSPTEVLEVERPRITQTFETVGLISAISSWVFSRGSYEGSFRGELEKFARIAERET